MTDIFAGFDEDDCENTEAWEKRDEDDDRTLEEFDYDARVKDYGQ